MGVNASQKGYATKWCEQRHQIVQHINLQLAALGQASFRDNSGQEFLDVAGDLLRNYRQQKRLLSDYRCPADQRIQDFLNNYFESHGVEAGIRLPGSTLILDKPNLAKELSLPPSEDGFESEYVKSYRLLQGVLHNPQSERRTTQGVFHIVEGGLPIPYDKKAVPVSSYRSLLAAALEPASEALKLPFTSTQTEQARVWVSLLMRPMVSPGVPGVVSEKSMEIRFFAPGGLVSNLDFVERIFGNAGDPYLPENDAALDIHHWTGHSGCIILAPHLTQLTKKSVGLPHFDSASERQRRDGMCWKDPQELYNDGQAFKIVCRDMTGAIVTVIADNYFGYSKKEIKSQISYSANLFGGCEEEHAGGALAFASYNLGDNFQPDSRVRSDGHTFDDMVSLYGELMEVKEPGYAVDKKHRNIVYVPENARMDLHAQTISWHRDGKTQSLKILADHTYVYPFGYKVQINKHPKAPSWRLVGTEADGTLCHKPCTVSGGGKSEISKSSASAIISGSLYVNDLGKDLDDVEEIFNKDYSMRFRNPPEGFVDDRSVLSHKRSLGSVIRLLTPSATEYTDEYNGWLESIPQHIRALVFIIKRFYRSEWGENWRSHFSVDSVNGYPGHELKCDERKLVASYLRVGLQQDEHWRLYKLRQDFSPAEKIQFEDDISVSFTAPASRLEYLNTDYRNLSVKLVHNCENTLFQRPDDAVHRGFDVQTELDLSSDGNFISNFEPLQPRDARLLIEDAINFDAYTVPMQNLILAAAEQEENSYFVSSSHPRLVSGKPSPNMRYLQPRPDIVNARSRYLADIGARFYRRVPLNEPVFFPVNAVLPGRRNNPPDLVNGLRSLAVYNPIHFQELPELFMDYICSLTGKSPSTTGAGSEGALTKGPFNALSATTDLNNALVSYILCGYNGFSSAAGYIGPYRQIDHDVSLLIPEIWCRLPVADREPRFLIEQGYLEKLEDFECNGRNILASRLGYRITNRFVHAYFGKIFDNPTDVFDEAMLRPESQDMESFVDGIENIVEAQRRVAQQYVDDGTVEDACPPLRALMYIMAHGKYDGCDETDPDFRRMFSREYLLDSEWYQQRLEIKHERDRQLWSRHLKYVRSFMGVATTEERESLGLAERLEEAERQLANVGIATPKDLLEGTIGADWIHRS